MAMVVFPEPPFGLITSVVFIAPLFFFSVIPTIYCWNMMLRLKTNGKSCVRFLAEAGARGGDVADDAQPGTRSAGHRSDGGAHRRHRRQTVDPLDDRLELLPLC